jgi:hypothetical protein
MRTLLLVAALLSISADGVRAADLPTVTVEHLYYLQARGERIRKLRLEEMVEYCLALKLGGAAFEDIYQQLFSMRVELTKLLKVDEVPERDPRIVKLKKTHEELTEVLRAEVEKIQNGLAREGQIATETMEAIARAQAGR